MHAPLIVLQNNFVPVKVCWILLHPNSDPSRNFSRIPIILYTITILIAPFYKIEIFSIREFFSFINVPINILKPSPPRRFNYLMALTPAILTAANAGFKKICFPPFRIAVKRAARSMIQGDQSYCPP